MLTYSDPETKKASCLAECLDCGHLFKIYGHTEYGYFVPYNEKDECPKCGSNEIEGKD